MQVSPLGAPAVQPPLTPWNRSVRVWGQVTGATVTVLAAHDGVVEAVGTAVADGPDFLVPLTAGVRLEPGWLVTARQQIDSEVSAPVPEASAVKVLREPDAPMLGSIFSRTAPMACGTCLWLEGVVPGTQVDVSIAGAAPISVQADATGVHVDVPPLGAGTTVTCSQRHGAVAGPAVTLPPPLPLPNSRRVDPPKVTQPIYPCQTVLDFTGVVPGAELAVDHGDDSYHFCLGSVRGRLRLGRALDINDAVRVSQSLTECGVDSDAVRIEVDGGVPPAPQWPHPVCRSDREVEVDGLLGDAWVQFLLGRDSGRLILVQAAPGQRRFHLPPFGNSLQVGVRQTLCGDGPWSATSWITLTDAGVPDQPAIQEPVHACATAVAVVGLSAGTKVTVVSARWGGPVGDAVAVGDAYTVVPLLFPASDGDRLSLELLRCGLPTVQEGFATVREWTAELRPPVLREPLDDAGGAITVAKLVPGAICDVEVYDPGSGRGQVIASEPVMLETAAVPVPPLAAGALVRCRQRLCSRVSEPSPVVRIGDEQPPYVRGSADRITALTGTRTGSRDPRYDTTEIGLTGTDLGITVEHDGRLYFLVGDADPEIVSDGTLAFVNLHDHDPIAWTTDDPRTPRGPWLNFLTTEHGYIRRLAVDGRPELGNFCVPTGAFSYGGRLYVFIADDKTEDPERMNTSHLAVTHDPGGVTEGFELLYSIASTSVAGLPAGDLLVHAAPVVVRGGDWPGLPTGGDGVILFFTGLYQQSNLHLGFVPFVYTGTSAKIGLGSPAPVDPPIPPPNQWYFWGRRAAGAPVEWLRSADVPPGGLEKLLPTWTAPGPTPADPFETLPVRLGEVSAAWIPQLHRWLTLHPGSGGVVVRTARQPWGPWSTRDVVIFNGDDVRFDATADNLQDGHRFAGLQHAKHPRPTGVYAPYLIAPWTRYDRSTRTLTLYYALSTEHPPYNVQLMSAQLRYLY